MTRFYGIFAFGAKSPQDTTTFFFELFCTRKRATPSCGELQFVATWVSPFLHRSSQWQWNVLLSFHNDAQAVRDVSGGAKPKVTSAMSHAVLPRGMRNNKK